MPGLRKGNSCSVPELSLSLPLYHRMPGVMFVLQGTRYRLVSSIGFGLAKLPEERVFVCFFNKTFGIVNFNSIYLVRYHFRHGADYQVYLTGQLAYI